MFEQKSTPKQIEANRLNAQKSTGPRSLEGKAASSMNALKSGIHAQSLIIRGESAEELQALTAEYYGHWQPATPQERLWLDALIRGEWLLRRLSVAEAQLWELGFDRGLKFRDVPSELAQIAGIYDLLFLRLQRRINDAHRNCAHALGQLERLQKLRREAEAEPALSLTEPPLAAPLAARP